MLPYLFGSAFLSRLSRQVVRGLPVRRSTLVFEDDLCICESSADPRPSHQVDVLDDDLLHTVLELLTRNADMSPLESDGKADLNTSVAELKYT